MSLKKTLGIAGVVILFGGGLITLLYFANKANTQNLHLALSVLAGIVAMSGVIMINGLLSMGRPPQVSGDNYSEEALQEEPQRELAQTENLYDETQQNIQEEQAKQQQKNNQA